MPKLTAPKNKANNIKPAKLKVPQKEIKRPKIAAPSSTAKNDPSPKVSQKPISSRMPSITPSKPNIKKVTEEKETVDTDVKKEEVEEMKDIVETPKQSISGNIIQPIRSNKRKHQSSVGNEPLHITADKVGPQVLDEKGIKLLSEDIANSLSDKFISREEVEIFIKQTIQKMIVK